MLERVILRRAGVTFRLCVSDTAVCALARLGVALACAWASTG
jgi:hypothetical protein